MIDLYVRDYPQWATGKKVDVVRRWIQEMKKRPEFQNLGLRVKMITEFIRTQEKKFAKAFELARELGIPPPSGPSHTLVQIQFAADLPSAKTPREQVESVCHYFDRLYHTLAPNFLPLDPPVPSPCVLENVRITLSSIPSITSSLSSPLPSDYFDSSPSSQSSRSTPEIPGPPNATPQLPPYNLPPETIILRSALHEDSVTESSILPSSTESWFSESPFSMHEFDSNVARCSSRAKREPFKVPEFTFHLPKHGVAPIPVPRLQESSECMSISWNRDPPSVRILGGRHLSSHIRINGDPPPVLTPHPRAALGIDAPDTLFTSAGLSKRLHDLDITGPRVNVITVPAGLQFSDSTSRPELPSNGPTKRKRGEEYEIPCNAEPTTFAHYGRAKKIARSQRNNARKLELEATMLDAQERSRQHIGEVDAHGRDNSGSSFDGGPKTAKLAGVNREYGKEESAPKARRRIGDPKGRKTPISVQHHLHRLGAELKCIILSIVFYFNQYTLLSSVENLLHVEATVKTLVETPDVNRDEFDSILAILQAASQIKRLCNARLQLLTSLDCQSISESSAMRPRWSLQRRHRLEIDPQSKLKEWFTANSEYPYPDHEKKLELAVMSGLSLASVSRWFINARSRANGGKPSYFLSHAVENGDHSRNTVALELLPLFASYEPGQFHSGAFECDSSSTSLQNTQHDSISFSDLLNSEF